MGCVGGAGAVEDAGGWVLLTVEELRGGRLMSSVAPILYPSLSPSPFPVTLGFLPETRCVSLLPWL